MMSAGPNRILILGGGFAGVYTARYLEKLLRAEEASITLINRENYWVYQPMLPEVIPGSIGLTNVVSPIRRLCPRTNLIMREVEDIDLKQQIVTVSPGFRPRPIQLKYDYLVIALGNITDLRGMPGLVENAMPFRTLADAIVLRNHLLQVLEEADVEDNPELRCQLLTFVVAGGGFSGVEVMAELNDFVHAVKRNYLHLRDEPHRCVIVQSGSRILPEMAETLAIFAQRVLRKRGIEIILNDRLKAATSEKAILQSGIEIPCKTLISTVPSALPPVIQKLDCLTEWGKLVVNTGLELNDYEGKVWALGDCAAVKTVAGTKVPPTAQHAIREAATAAINIAAAVRGGKRAEFAFEGLGTFGSLGHCAAVAQVFGIRISGLLAWLMWRCIYLMKMPGLNRKVRIATDWLLHLLFPPELAQTTIAVESAIRQQHFEPGDSIFRQGDLGDSVYVIEKGECQVYREHKDQQELIATLGCGQYFGEMALLSDRTRNATIRACTAMDVLIIPKAEFNKLRRCVPAFGNFFSDLASARALTASPHSSTERLGTYISKMAGEMRQVNGQDSAEPTPDEMMHEPIIRLMMESDHVTEDVLRHVMTIACRRLGHATHQRQEYRTVVRDDLLLD
jgi:NADH:ubiquinone reductase (H+-translocating)